MILCLCPEFTKTTPANLGKNPWVLSILQRFNIASYWIYSSPLPPAVKRAKERHVAYTSRPLRPHLRAYQQGRWSFPAYVAGMLGGNHFNTSGQRIEKPNKGLVESTNHTIFPYFPQ